VFRQALCFALLPLICRVATFTILTINHDATAKTIN
jgi:hypothetical protein